jgi:hypothetical protein
MSKKFINLIIFFIGLIFSFIFAIYIHEIGHYIPACFFNCSAIREININPLEIIKTITEFKNVNLGSVEFNENYLYKEWQYLVIAFGGLFAQLMFLFLILIIKNKTKIYSKFYFFMVGVYIGIFQILFSWISDGVKAVRFITADRTIMFLILIIIAVLIIQLYIKNIFKIYKELYNIRNFVDLKY